MRIVFLIGMLAALGGCAVQRDVTFIYYPNAPHREKDPFPPASYMECTRCMFGTASGISAGSGLITLVSSDRRGLTSD
jgi:hypothetical protein